MPLIRLRALCAIAVLSLYASGATSAADLTEPIRFERELKVGRLANGLAYYIKRNAMPEKQLEMQLVLKVGSLVEDDDQQGLAHFVEHMGFNGSSNFKKHE